MNINVYFANFTSHIIETALADSNGNAGLITRGSNFVDGSPVGPGLQIAPNTISPVLGVINTDLPFFDSTPWDWMYFNLLNDDLSIALKLQAFLKIGNGSCTIVEVGPYDESTSNSNLMPQGTYRTYGGANSSGIYFILADTDLPA